MTIELQLVVTVVTVVASVASAYGTMRTQLRLNERHIEDLRIQINDARKAHADLLAGDATGVSRFVTRDRCDERTGRIENILEQLQRHVASCANYARWALGQQGLQPHEIERIVNGNASSGGDSGKS